METCAAVEALVRNQMFANATLDILDKGVSISNAMALPEMMQRCAVATGSVQMPIIAFVKSIMVACNATNLPVMAYQAQMPMFAVRTAHVQHQIRAPAKRGIPEMLAVNFHALELRAVTPMFARVEEAAQRQILVAAEMDLQDRLVKRLSLPRVVVFHLLIPPFAVAMGNACKTMFALVKPDIRAICAKPSTAMARRPPMLLFAVDMEPVQRLILAHALVDILAMNAMHLIALVF